MKNENFILNHKIRHLILNKEVQEIVKDLFKMHNSMKEAIIYLPLLNDCIYRTIKKASVEMGSFNIENCFNMEDVILLEELNKLKVLELKDVFEKEANEGMGLGYVATILIKNKKYIEFLYQWICDLRLIINYGIFSLHTFTGEAYCLDSKYIFHTNKGLFRVFKAFIEEPTHIFTYKQIYQHYQDSTADTLRYNSETIHQIIGEIREKLQMKGKLSKLFLPAGDRYILKNINQ